MNGTFTLVAVAAIAGCTHGTPPAGSGSGAPPAGSGPVVTCQDIEADHKATEQATRTSYERALAAKHLVPAPLAPTQAPTYETEAEADAKLFGHAVAPWTQATYIADGHSTNVIVGEMYVTSYDPREQAEFVTDGAGGVWRVRHAPQARPIKTFSVKTCGWGCWGWPGAGARMQERYTRDIWPVPDGQTFRGDVTIAYDAPMLAINIIDQQCGSPP